MTWRTAHICIVQCLDVSACRYTHSERHKHCSDRTLSMKGYETSIQKKEVEISFSLFFNED